MKTTLIVGLGAVGSHVALAMRNEGRLVLCDHDRVEAKNLMAQNYAGDCVGDNKAHCTAQSLDAFEYLELSMLDCVPRKLALLNASHIMNGVDLVVDCTDNIAARTAMAEVASDLKLPLLHASVSADGSCGRSGWAPEFVPDAEEPGVPTCEDGAALPFYLMFGGLIATQAQAFLRTGEQRSAFLTAKNLI